MPSLTLRLDFFLSLLLSTSLVNTFEMTDDLTYLSMKLFLKNQQFIWKYHIRNITHFHVIIIVWFLRKTQMLELLLFETILARNYYWKREKGIESKRGGAWELFPWSSSSLQITNYSLFFILKILTYKKLHKHPFNKKCNKCKKIT